MDRRNLPLSALRAFESAAQHLNLSQAGEQLGVTHGAISHQIRSLEEQLQVQLFSRAHNRLSLTPAGVRLYESVTKGFNIIVDGTRNLNPQELSGQLVIACTQTIASVWAAKPICSFYQKYPTIEIVVREIKPLQKNIPLDVDIAICYGEPHADSREMTSFATPLLRPVCNPTLLKNCRPVRKVMDLLQFPLIHDAAVPWSRWFEHHGASGVKPPQNLYFANTSQALTVARLGYGVALGNSFETKQFIEEGELIQLLEDNPIEEEHGYFLLRAKEEHKPLKVHVFEEWLKQAFA